MKLKKLTPVEILVLMSFIGSILIYATFSSHQIYYIKDIKSLHGKVSSKGVRKRFVFFGDVNEYYLTFERFGLDKKVNVTPKIWKNIKKGDDFY